MPDTTRSLASLQTLLADNVAGDISAQDVRDFLVSAYKPQALTPGGRLTTESGVGASTSDRTSQGTIYYTPFTHNGIGLYDGTSWTLHTFTERSLALSSLTTDKNYDVFLYDNAGTLTLELSAAWTNDTTRADALTTQDGVYVKSGATSRRWVGTIRTTSTTTTEDSMGGTSSSVGGKRFVWNAYNRVARPLWVIDTTDSWTYSTDAFRQTRATTGNRVEYVCGAVDLVGAVALSHCGASGGAILLASGVGVDSTTVNSAQIFSGATAGASLSAIGVSQYRGFPGIGYHALNWLERASVSGTTTWYGDVGVTNIQTGLYAEVMG